jgi:hypothetical protein
MQVPFPCRIQRDTVFVLSNEAEFLCNKLVTNLVSDGKRKNICRITVVQKGSPMHNIV